MFDVSNSSDLSIDVKPTVMEIPSGLGSPLYEAGSALSMKSWMNSYRKMDHFLMNQLQVMLQRNQKLQMEKLVRIFYSALLLINTVV